MLVPALFSFLQMLGMALFLAYIYCEFVGFHRIEYKSFLKLALSSGHHLKSRDLLHFLYPRVCN